VEKHGFLLGAESVQRYEPVGDGDGDGFRACEVDA